MEHETSLFRKEHTHPELARGRYLIIQKQERNFQGIFFMQLLNSWTEESNLAFETER